MKPNSNFILSITPNYAYGRRQGFTDGETYVLAEEAYSLMQIAEEKQAAKKPIIENYSPAKCPSCGKEMSQDLGDGYYQHHDALKVCDCGQKLDWSEEE